MLEGANVRVGQIGHVNEVANGRAVWRRILIAEYSNFFLGVGVLPRERWVSNAFRDRDPRQSVQWRRQH